MSGERSKKVFASKESFAKEEGFAKSQRPTRYDMQRPTDQRFAGSLFSLFSWSANNHFYRLPPASLGRFSTGVWNNPWLLRLLNYSWCMTIVYSWLRLSNVLHVSIFPSLISLSIHPSILFTTTNQSRLDFSQSCQHLWMIWDCFHTEILVNQVKIEITRYLKPVSSPFQ